MPQYGKLTHPRPPPDPDGIELDGLGDVQREIAKVYRDMRKARIDSDDGSRLVNALNVLKGVMTERIDRKWLPRMKEMWRENEAKRAAAATVEPARLNS